MTNLFELPLDQIKPIGGPIEHKAFSVRPISPEFARRLAEINIIAPLPPGFQDAIYGALSEHDKNIFRNRR